jgi:hypothetical protein
MMVFSSDVKPTRCRAGNEVNCAAWIGRPETTDHAPAVPGCSLPDVRIGPVMAFFGC